MQNPRPSQKEASTSSEASLHEAAPQGVPCAGSWQEPRPSQKPVAPQEVAGSAVQSSSGSAPAWMGPHAPSGPAPFFAAEQAMHAPAQGVSQQTPSTQEAPA